MKNHKNANNKNPLILIIDDNKLNMKIITQTLKKEKYLLATANNGKKGLEMIQNIPPDLILLDIIMPEINGFEVCKRLKASPKTKAIPIILLTARTDTKDIIKGLKLGAIDYITKPFNTAELNARVKTQIELKKARDTQKNLIEKLEKALADVKKLSGLLPICAGCKKIRNDKGYWEQIETYIHNHSEADFTHGLCPECMERLYPDYSKDDEE